MTHALVAKAVRHIIPAAAVWIFIPRLVVGSSYDCSDEPHPLWFRRLIDAEDTLFMLGNHLGFSIYLGNFIHRTSTSIATGHNYEIKNEQYK